VTDAELAAFARSIAHLMLRTGQIPAAVDVEDAAQAGLVAALEARKRHDGTRASFRTFVGIRIRGAIRDEIHRQMRAYVEASYDELEAVDHAPGHMETPERHAMHYERLTRLVAAINRLPVRWQRVLVLRYRDDWTQREIAQDFGITEGRVSQMHSEAVDRLRAQA
jgi:RNA polymerase sigma factor FliA